MLVKTRFFGEVDLPEEKILTFEHGLIGLGEYKKFTILYDCDKEDSNISWLQSVEEPSFALPVIKPWLVKEDYNPVVEDELLKHIGELTEESCYFDHHDRAGRCKTDVCKLKSTDHHQCRHPQGSTDHL